MENCHENIFVAILPLSSIQEYASRRMFVSSCLHGERNMQCERNRYLLNVNPETVWLTFQT